jgi:hypothetical protein
MWGRYMGGLIWRGENSKRIFVVMVVNCITTAGSTMSGGIRKLKQWHRYHATGHSRNTPLAGFAGNLEYYHLMGCKVPQKNFTMMDTPHGATISDRKRMIGLS